jgi:hypothetical protein
MSQYTTIEEQVEYGLDKIDPERKIEVPLKDLLFAYLTVGELVRFFHQPLHHPSLKSVEDFMGHAESGALHLLWEIYYKKLRDVWPDDIRQRFEEGDFEHPDPPYYYRAEE